MKRSRGMILLLVGLAWGALLAGAATLASPAAPRTQAAPRVEPTVSPYSGGCPPLVIENFESATLGYFDSSGDPGWHVNSSYPLHGWYSAEAAFVKGTPPPPPPIPPQLIYPVLLNQSFLTLRDPVILPTSASTATLTFWQRDNGYALQISTDNGINWIGLDYQRDYGNRRIADLSPYRGFAIKIRYYVALGLTSNYPQRGDGPPHYWWDIDDIVITAPVPGCATATATPTPTFTATPHPGIFEDVPPNNTFYDYIECLGGRGILGGYPCGTPLEPCHAYNKPYFRPGNSLTRAQAAKIVASAAGFNDNISPFQQTFEDVELDNSYQTVWLPVERLVMRGLIGGYPCGSNPFEPCVPPTNRPYFRRNTNVTRGQLAKIAVGAAAYTETPTSQTFADVPPGNTFYPYVERMASRGIIGGYPCGGVGEPCQPPTNRPYFRPNNPVTRGQAAKIVSSTFFPGCQDPTPTPTPFRTPTGIPFPTGIPQPTDTPTIPATSTSTPLPTETPTLTPTGTLAPPTATPTP